MTFQKLRFCHCRGAPRIDCNKAFFLLAGNVLLSVHSHRYSRKNTVRSASNDHPQTLPIQLARSRLPFGTQKVSLNAASFLTWHGSWIPVAKDPNVITTYIGRLHKISPSAEHHPCYSGLQVQGAANSPAARFLYYKCYIPTLSSKVNHLSYSCKLRYGVWAVVAQLVQIICL